MASNVTGTSFTDTGADQRHDVLLHGRRGERGRHLRPVRRGVGHPAGDRAVSAAGAGRVGRQRVGEAVVDAPRRRTAASAVTGYDIYRGTTPGGESGTPVATGVTATSFTDAGAGQRHDVLLHGGRGQRASAPPPRPARRRPPRQATVPSAPPGWSPGGNASVALSWTAPASDGGAGDHRLQRLPRAPAPAASQARR